MKSKKPVAPFAGVIAHVNYNDNDFGDFGVNSVSYDCNCFFFRVPVRTT